MKIIQLKSENFKGLKAISITPDANFQIISGKNEQGKSSVLDSMWAAIEGKAALKDTDKPIRNGESKAFVSVDLGDIVVTRKWNGNDKSTLEVTAKDGAKYSSPQTMLDNMIGKLSFDPLSFANQDDKKQKATLQELVGINFDTLDKERAGHYEERTFHNVSAKKLEGALSELPVPNADTPKEEVNGSDIIKELTDANNVIRANQDKRISLEACAKEGKKLSDDIEEMKKHLAGQELELTKLRFRYESLNTEVKSLVDPDTSAIQSKLENIETINKRVAAAAKFYRLQEEIAEYKSSSKFLSDKIDDIDKRKLENLQAAVFPIEGLSFDENGVTFNGVPFKQCSAAQRLKVSMAMAMALNPKLRVIRILDGSLLDSDNLKIVHDMAIAQDYQVWMEIVDESGKMGVVIEDGQVKEADNDEF